MAGRISTVQEEDGFQDSLDGKPLEAGDRLYVRWPAGSLAKVEVKVDFVHRALVVAGVTTQVLCRKAYMEIAVQSGVARVYLHGFEAQRI